MRGGEEVPEYCILVYCIQYTALKLQLKPFPFPHNSEKRANDEVTDTVISLASKPITLALSSSIPPWRVLETANTSA